jgi:hypothetical protein
MKIGWFSNMYLCGTENACARFHDSLLNQVNISKIELLLITGTFAGAADYFSLYTGKFLPFLSDTIPLILSPSPSDLGSYSLDNLPAQAREWERQISKISRPHTRVVTCGYNGELVSLNSGESVYFSAFAFSDYSSLGDRQEEYSLKEWEKYYEFQHADSRRERWEVTKKLNTKLLNDFKKRLKTAVYKKPKSIIISLDVAPFYRMFQVDSNKFIGNKDKHWQKVNQDMGGILTEVINEHPEIKFIVLCDGTNRQYNIVKENNMTAILANSYTKNEKGQIAPAFHQLEL